jgi:TPR repeat protein
MEQIKIGNIAAARRFFELAAEAGLASSVMELASTYDPNELGKFGAFAPRPDVEAAQRLYRKAQQLGAADAEERLRRLATR